MVKPTREAIITNIEDIRTNNNYLWMDILRLALEVAPDRTRIIIKDIINNDKDVDKWLAKL